MDALALIKEINLVQKQRESSSEMISRLGRGKK